ncbi:MAG: alkaline phosphatase family protein [Flavobacteriaceae bacterium]
MNLQKLASLVIVLFCISCSVKKDLGQKSNTNTDFIIAFGSCNKQYQKNVLWKEIKKNKPDLWIWGGDNIYSDTDDMVKMWKDYEELNQQEGYLNLVKNIPVLATWDDHDYGLNDGGKEFVKKKNAQHLFLDFFKVSKDSPRRKQEGIYHAQLFETKNGSIKVIVLDTRFFRTSLTKSNTKNKRYDPNPYGKGTILGATQWEWLKEELFNSKADFNIIVSSIQFLSSEHGFESWGNFTHEVEALKKLIVDSNAKKVMLLSGDRHISEFSKTLLPNNYPLIDFTSSGLTHSYESFTSEPNKYRVKNVISQISFGLLKFDFKNNTIIMEMRGVKNKLQQQYIQVYP